MWLFTKNISTNQLAKKLYHKIIGFFEVIKKKNNISLKLQLFQAIKIYNNFQPNLLQKALTNLLTSQINELTLSIIINNEDK